MSRLIRGATIVLFALPLGFVLLPALTNGPVHMSAVGLFVAAMYAAIWIWWRPGRFDVSPSIVRIVFPGRSREIPTQEVAVCRPLTPGEFRTEFGRAIRIGIGGLWGGFGWLYTTKRGLIDFYVSRTDGFVVLERHHRRSILITPERPERFAEVVTASLTQVAV
jgi:hypothetical protein